MLGANVSIAADADVGGNVVLHEGVVVGAGCTIQGNAVVGKAPLLGARSSAPRRELGPTFLETGSAVCASAVVFAGAHIGARSIVGDHAYVRERAVMGADSVLGRGSASDMILESEIASPFRPTSGSPTTPWSRTTSSSAPES